MGKYTSKYTGQQIDDKLDSIGADKVRIIDLPSGNSGTISAEDLAAMNSNPGNCIVRHDFGSSDWRWATLAYETASQYSYCKILSKGMKGDNQGLYGEVINYTINKTTGAWTKAVNYGQIMCNPTIPSGKTKVALNVIQDGDTYYTIDIPSIVKLAAGAFTSYTAKSIATLISEGYNYVRLTGYRSDADKHQRSWLVSLATLNAGTTVEIQEAISGWTTAAYIYIFNSNGNIA